MRHFQLVGSMDPVPLLMALQQRPELWNQHAFRTTRPGSTMTEVDDILLRFTAPEHLDRNDDDTAPVFYPAWQQLPQARPVVFELMRRVEAVRLDRVLISRLPPGGRIPEHTDADAGYSRRDGMMRLHVALQGLPGSLYHCGGETISMMSGQVWWFNHREMHSVENNSADDRVHLMVDVATE